MPQETFLNFQPFYLICHWIAAVILKAVFEVMVKLWFKKSWIRISFHVYVNYSLCFFKTGLCWLLNIPYNCFPRRTVNVNLKQKTTLLISLNICKRKVRKIEFRGLLLNTFYLYLFIYPLISNQHLPKPIDCSRVDFSYCQKIPSY